MCSFGVLGLVGLHGGCCMFVLLNIILYCGNSLCRYLVDLDAISLVS
jgi:hypothetical protein